MSISDNSPRTNTPPGIAVNAASARQDWKIKIIGGTLL